jgi:O-antigen/teichoic acid export membrane protein
VSRIRRAGITASFGYLQFAFGFASGILLVPFILASVGAESYGLWLGLGELIAYAAMTDLGILAVLPWLVAEADGRGDRERFGRLVSAALVASGIAAVAFGALAIGMLALAPRFAAIDAGARALVLGPLLVLIAGSAVAYPLRVFHAVLVGVQDVAFTGTLAVAQAALNVLLLVVLLLAGHGVYALAIAATVPPLVVALASLWRAARLLPELVGSLRVPGLTLLREVATQGLGAWTAGLGWRMIAASSTFVILAFLGPVPAVVFAMTARLGEVLMQMAWMLPDAGLVGLAQLRGEGREERVREVVISFVRLTLLGGGAVACVVLALNPSFVALWLGEARFAGPLTNALLAGAVLALSFGHALFATAATLGARVQIGIVTVAQGVVHVAAAVLLGRAFGLPGVAAAALVSTALVAAPAGMRLLGSAVGVGPRALWDGALWPWLARAPALLALAAAIGVLLRPVWVGAPVALAPALGLLYLVWMRPLYVGLPFPPRVGDLLRRLRLLPAAAAPAVPPA